MSHSDVGDLLKLVERLEQENERLKAELDRANAACAAKHEMLTRVIRDMEENDKSVDIIDLRQSVASDCGKALLEERDALLKQIGEIDQEIGDFQNEVRALVIRLTGAPDNAIDGKGSDEGWQEFTLCEISQGIAFVKEERDALRKALDELAKFSVEGMKAALGKDEG